MGRILGRVPDRRGPAGGGRKRLNSRSDPVRDGVRQSAAMRSIALLLFAATTAAAEPIALPRSTPEAQGVRSSAILGFVEAAEKSVDSLHSLMVLRHGHVVAEGWWGPYRRDDPHMLFSLSKSFTSTGIGLAIAEGKLSLDDTVLSFFPEDAPAEPSENLKAMRVRDLLSMSTGHHADVIDRFPFTDPGVSRTRAFLALPVAHKPGTLFVYNTPASYMLSAIVQKVSGTPLVDYLGPRLFEPLGIRSPKWDADPKGVSLGGFGLSVTTEDIARFGQLYLQKGVWDGRRVLPADWVAAASARQVSNGSNPASDWDQGYGYQFWRCRHDVYRGDGAHGQNCIVMPNEDAVIAITSGVRDLPAVLDLVWEHLLPAMTAQTPLPADPVVQDRLSKKLASLSLPPQPGRPTSPVARQVSGQLYELPKNEDHLEAIGLETGAGTTLVLRSGGRDRRVPVGHGEWLRGGTLLVDGVEQKVAATGAWTADDTFTVKACRYETPFCATLGLWFAGRALVLDQETNVGSSPARRPQLVGRPSGGARSAVEEHDSRPDPARRKP
jgi:CubicO group peptidase (beta-lactamase class C family)